jgi:hypothetical protein
MRAAAYAVPPPDEVIAEREHAIAAQATLPPGEAHLGSPPPTRSALAGVHRRAGREFNPRFLLLTPWADDR